MINPPPVKIPAKFLEDPSTEVFIRELLDSVRLMWMHNEKHVGFYGTDPVVQASSLTASDTNTPNSGDATTDAIIENLQTRVDELEDRLSSTGIGVFS